MANQVTNHEPKVEVKAESTNGTSNSNGSNGANSAAAGLGLGDVSVIRDILMGQHIATFNHRFEALEQLVAHNEQLTQQRLETLTAQTNTHFEHLEAQTNARFDRLEQLLAQNVEALTQRMDSGGKSDRHQLADLLVEVSKQLKSK